MESELREIAVTLRAIRQRVEGKAVQEGFWIGRRGAAIPLGPDIALSSRLGDAPSVPVDLVASQKDGAGDEDDAPCHTVADLLADVIETLVDIASALPRPPGQGQPAQGQGVLPNESQALQEWTHGLGLSYNIILSSLLTP